MTFDSLLPLEAYLENKKKPQKKIESHWPSNASIETPKGVIGACLKAQWLGWKGIEWSNPPDLTSIFKWEMGHVLEQWYEEGLKLLKIEYQREVPFKLDLGLKYQMSGRKDFVIDDGKSGIELKSSFGQGMNKAKLEGLPKDPYLLQMLCYFQDKSIDIFYNPFVARDSFFRMSFKVYPNKDGTLWCNGKTIEFTFAQVVDRWRKLEQYLEEDKEPPRDFNSKEKYPCSWCSYKDYCWR